MPPRGPAPAISRRMEHHRKGLRCPPQRHHRRDGPGFYEPLPALRHDARRRRRRPGLRRASRRPDDDRSWSDRLPPDSPGPHGSPVKSTEREACDTATSAESWELCAGGTVAATSRRRRRRSWPRSCPRRARRGAAAATTDRARARSKIWRSRARAAPRSRARTASAAATGRRRRRRRRRAGRPCRRGARGSPRRPPRRCAPAEALRGGPGGSTPRKPTSRRGRRAARRPKPGETRAAAPDRHSGTE